MRTSTLLTAALAPAAVVLTLGMATPAMAAPTAPVTSGMEIRTEKVLVDFGAGQLVTPSKCTLGAVISPSRALTAGHCGKRGTKVYNAQRRKIGTITANLIGRRADIGVIALVPGLRVRVDSIDWGSRVAAGSPVSKSGITTGLTRGVVLDPRPKLARAVECPPLTPSEACRVLPPALLVNQSTYVVATNFRSRPGDSGSGVRNGSGQVVGIVSSIPADPKAKQRSFYAPVALVPGHLR
ncbi:hypothetical protein GOARA_043_00070 [Gordonia araii NBRC 100433]|uniref:Peptidase S1 domain-containing protein n=1 Tax=Gordonia araii NBRC 100433 TaxID=1073574 RepID=G7H172_9ACTN|nr:trypsin-like serine protease [Gordonia araii]NNG96780.1 trypsin-like serine protease [Gordonia araii NBRC 100433]GAB09532.1 hypothetical protein GOARA_043_00070 [Gordonia araii NBRC 100433]